MRYTKIQWVKSWFKKRLGIHSPSYLIVGFHYEYDFMLAMHKARKNIIKNIKEPTEETKKFAEDYSNVCLEGSEQMNRLNERNNSKHELIK